jgi:hypothetical protein
MLRAICLALICLLGMGALLALRPSSEESTAPVLAAMASGPSTFATNSDEELNLTSLSVNTWSKADKLPIASSEDEKKAVPVEEIKLDPIIKADDALNRPETKPARQVTRWHWHAGSKKIERH